MLKRLRPAFQNAVQTDDLLDVMPDLAILDVRLEGLLRRLDKGEEDLWPEVVDLVERRLKRVEAAWALRLRRQEAINKDDLAKMFVVPIDVVQEEAGPGAAQRVTQRIDEVIRAS